MTHYLHYAAKNPIDPRWMDQPCRVLVWSRKSVLAVTGIGLVITIRRNVWSEKRFKALMARRKEKS